MNWSRLWVAHRDTRDYIHIFLIYISVNVCLYAPYTKPQFSTDWPEILYTGLGLIRTVNGKTELENMSLFFWLMVKWLFSWLKQYLKFISPISYIYLFFTLKYENHNYYSISSEKWFLLNQQYTTHYLIFETIVLISYLTFAFLLWNKKIKKTQLLFYMSTENDLF